MRNTITLPVKRVAALVAETGDVLPERVIAKLLSTLYSREMWAHLDARKSTNEVAVFVYGSNVPTPTNSTRRTRDSKRNRKAVAV